MSGLSKLLFREVRPDFFRVLSGPLARLYVDVLDLLDKESSERSQGLDRDEALALVENVVEAYGEIPQSEDDWVATAKTNRDKARGILEILRKAGWVQEEEKSDWQRLIFFEPHGTVLLQAIRKIAYPDAAIFSDKLLNVCFTLANHEALSDQPWSQIESCVANLEAGLAELRGMQKSIERHTRQQVAATTLKENLAVLFDHFAEQIGRACYTQLVQARLPSKISETRRSLDEISSNMDLLTRMQTEVMRRDAALTPESAMSHVLLRLHELAGLLDHIEPLADAIDRRTAEFARRSQARFRYLQETTSENRARVQEFFERINRHFAGGRIGDLGEEALAFPGLLLQDTKLAGGLESLYVPRLRRAAGEIEPLEDSDDRQRDRTLAQLESTMRDSLTVSRANHFVAHLAKGASATSSDLLRDRVHNDEDVADMIACLLHARSADARFDIQVPRRESDTDEMEFDSKLQYRIERFIVVKK